MFSQLRRLEAQVQDASRVGKNCPCGLQMVTFSLSSRGLSFVPACLGTEGGGGGERKSELSGVSSHEALILLDLSLTLTALFNLKCFLRDPVSKYSHTGV